MEVSSTDFVSSAKLNFSLKVSDKSVFIHLEDGLNSFFFVDL